MIKGYALTEKHTDGENPSVKSVIDFYRRNVSTDRGHPNLPTDSFDGCQPSKFTNGFFDRYFYG